MQLTSSVFAEGQAIPPEFTCSGRNVSPPLSIRDIPSGTRSLALILDDPDAPSGSFLHWIFWNMPLDMFEIPQGGPPPGAVVGTNGTGKIGYFGPCPPSGIHHYRFRLFALDAMLNLDPTATREQVEAAIQGHVVAETVFTGIFEKSK